MDSKRKYDLQDFQFEKWLDQQFAAVIESELTPKKRAARRARADADPLEFCKIYFPNIFDLPWNDAHRWIASLKEGLYTLSGFRICGKSASTYIMHAIRSLALGVGGIVNVNARTMDISNERTRQLIRLMERNRLLMYDYAVEIQQRLKGYYIVNGTYLIAGSYTTGLRNLVDDEFKRIRIAINDDLYNAESVTSETDNERVTTFVDSEVSGQLEAGGLSITMGNSITADCPIVRLKKAHPENHFSLPALDAKGRSTWPEYRTPEEWEKFFKTIPYSVRISEYMDQPALQGDVFDPAWLRSVNINAIVRDLCLAAVDPSHGASPQACNKAFAVMMREKKKSGAKLVITDLYARTEDYVQFFHYVHRSHQEWGWMTLLFEDDFNQWGFARPYYDRWRERHHHTIPILRYSSKSLATEHHGADKDGRIMNLVYPYQVGEIVYTDDVMKTPDYQKHKVEYLGFGKAKTKLDTLDAIATLYIMTTRWITTGTFKSLKKKTYGRTQTWFRK